MIFSAIRKSNVFARWLDATHSWQRSKFDRALSSNNHKGGSTIYALSSGPNSFTGEDTVEFQIHGGPAVLTSLMSALSKLKFRLAEPGEFTRRSFYNNKLDLTEIEGLADLIHAETEQQRRQALLQADGSLSELYNNWRRALSHSLAHLEAHIDFSEEENIEGDVLEKCHQNLKDLAQKIEDHLADGRRGEILRSGVRTVILGKPNVGKSSLLNNLVQRNAAIVTSVAGTTRDIIELTSNISGYPVILADTAGLSKNSEDFIEKEGIRRARLHAEKADFIILVADAAEFQKSGKSFEEYLREYVESLELGAILGGGKLRKNYVVVMNKTDLLDEEVKTVFRGDNVVAISCEMKEGFQDLVNCMTKSFSEICGNPSRENPTISQTRHRTHLINCLDHINNYFEMNSKDNHDAVIEAEQIRRAMRELGKITGHMAPRDIFHARAKRVFPSFFQRGL
ncbi:tRNA modification GTPase GTPBP3, mitochondrial [Belonocnema kinseyi]|uniref:tRNA modification GTPase GTPBP3, mitochondrial n=1 Tax=Belonocnema kinseyi TaxID=2817044 RepID=UPI00143D6FCF|nr:tRNA modification GTPase GTPBP3, mitochondrial [Belonocnema kinseyi]